MGDVGCLVGRLAVLVGFLGGSVLVVYLARVVKKIRVASVFVFKVILVGSLVVSGPCTL